MVNERGICMIPQPLIIPSDILHKLNETTFPAEAPCPAVSVVVFELNR